MRAFPTIALAAARVLAAATDFHHSRFLSFFAVLAAECAALFGRAVTRAVRTLASRFFSHEKPPRRFKSRMFQFLGECELMLDLDRRSGQDRAFYFNGRLR